MSMTDYGNIDLQDRVAVVTGAASGMGREVAIALTSLGARVCVGDINTDGLESLKAEIGENCVMQPTDITKEESSRGIGELCSVILWRGAYWRQLRRCWWRCANFGLQCQEMEIFR